MATIPTLPNIAAGQVVFAADLNNIANACTFLLNKPMARAHDSTGAHAITSSYSTLAFTGKDFDTDGLWSNSSNQRLTVQTPGWYKVRYSVQIAAASGGGTLNTKIQATSGSANPIGAGVVIGSGVDGYQQQNVTTSVTSFCGSSGLFPYYLYTGDFLQVRIRANASGPTTGADASQPFTYLCVQFVSA